MIMTGFVWSAQRQEAGHRAQAMTMRAPRRY
jgi:hypothetical protein